MISDALDLNLVSRIVGYKLAKGDFSTTTPNLPQSIAVFAEANTANQSTLSLTPTQMTSAAQAGLAYGYGSPIYSIMRILQPVNGGGSSIPVFVYPQLAAVASVAKVITITVTGTATASGKHTAQLNGRQGLDGVFYNANILSGDTATIIAGSLRDAINAVLGSPVIATSALGVVTLTAKWTGLTSDALNASIVTGTNTLGITYAVANVTAGSGTPSVTSALNSIGASWVTLAINSYGTDTQTMSLFEAFNGIPDATTPTGRFVGNIMKPLIALTGSVADNDSTLTDARLNDVTISICPTPLSLGFQFEAAANYAVVQGNLANNTPHLDVEGKSLPDMPTPTSIGTMAVYANRDVYVKKGNSTVDLVGGKYVIQDFVTTYHKLGETPPQFRYVRNLTVDFNIRYAYYLLEQINVVDHVISGDNDITSVSGVIKPKQWKGILSTTLFPDLAKRALITGVDFSQNNLSVGISSTNPDRFETAFSYKRTGTARVIATTATAGFNFGTI